MGLDRLIAEASNTHSLDAALVAALIRVESGGNTWASNPEPPYHYLWDVKKKRPFRGLSIVEATSMFPPRDFYALSGDTDQEFWNQRTSWGLMQVMGAVARERGFTGPYLTELCDPVLNLSIGAAHLSAALAWAKGDERLGLASYNAGRGGALGTAGQAYASRVIAARTREA